MKALEDISIQVKERFASLVKPLKQKVFGNNNETIDFLMDSFYKLSPEHRAGVVFGGGVAAVFLTIGILWFYFSRVAALEGELNRSFNMLHELRSLKTQYASEQERYDRLVNNITRKTSALRTKPFFEEKAQSLGIEMQGLNDKPEPLPVENPLSQKMNYVKVEVRLPKISIPRLLSLLTEVEKSGNYLSVEDLTIRNRLGTKLYFDADVEFRGYKAEGM